MFISDDPNENWGQLLLAAKSDVSKFSAFLKVAEGKLRAHFRRLRVKGDLDEVVHLSTIKIWQTLSQFDREKGSGETWVYTLANHAYIDYLRKELRHRFNVSVDTLGVGALSVGASSEYDPVLIAERDELLRCLLAALPEEQDREIMILHCLEGLTREQINQKLNLNLTVQQFYRRVFHIREKLRGADVD